MTSFDTWPPIRIAGTGSYVPERVVTNEDLVRGGLSTSGAWIEEHTGITERRFAGEDEATSDLAAAAGRAAIEAADCYPDDIDLVIVATSTPDWPQPATASAVHHALALRGDVGAMDVNAVCSGFIYALHSAASMLASCDAWTNVLVIGADCYSRITDPNDRTTRVFFGDGAGAVVLRKELEIADVAMFAAHEAGIDPGDGLDDVDGGIDEDDTPGIRSISYTVDHSRKDALIVRAGGSREPLRTVPGAGGTPGLSPRRWFSMDGPAVKTFAIPAMIEGVETACRDAGVMPSELALVVPHQSNRRMLEAAIDGLGLPESRLATTVEMLGNTAAASIPITLDHAVRAGRVADGDLIALVGYGGGLASAACVLRWST